MDCITQAGFCYLAGSFNILFLQCFYNSCTVIYVPVNSHDLYSSHPWTIPSGYTTITAINVACLHTNVMAFI